MQDVWIVAGALRIRLLVEKPEIPVGRHSDTEPLINRLALDVRSIVQTSSEHLQQILQDRDSNSHNAMLHSLTPSSWFLYIHSIDVSTSKALGFIPAALVNDSIVPKLVRSRHLRSASRDLFTRDVGEDSFRNFSQVHSSFSLSTIHFMAFRVQTISQMR